MICIQHTISIDQKLLQKKKAYTTNFKNLQATMHQFKQKQNHINVLLLKPGIQPCFIQNLKTLPISILISNGLINVLQKT